MELSVNIIMIKNLPNPILSLAFLVGIVFFFFNCHPLLTDYDTGWHLAAGDSIRRLGYIPTTDTWSYSGTHAVWYNISWLWDVVLSFINSHIGFPGLFIFNILLYALIIVTIAYNLLLRRLNTSVIAVTILLSCLPLVSFVCLRPYGFSFLAVSVFQALLYKYEQTKRFKYLVILPLLMSLWVNIHGAFIAGFIVIGVYCLSVVMEKKWREMVVLLMLIFVCLIALLVNPYGLDIYKAVMSTTASKFTKSIDEWQGFSFGKDGYFAMYFLVFLVFSNFRENSIRYFDRIMAFLWLFAGLNAIRNIPIFVVCAAPYLAMNIEGTKITRVLPNMDSMKMRVFAVAINIVVILSFIPFLTEDKVDGKQFLPIKAIEFIQRTYPDKRFLNDYSIGGQIIYLSNGKLPVFVDGRAGTAYDEEILQDYLLLASSLERDDLLTKYKIDGVVTYDNRSLDVKFRNKPGWRRVFREDGYCVYVR